MKANTYPHGYCSIHGKQSGYPGRTDCHIKITRNGYRDYCGKRLTSKPDK